MQTNVGILTFMSGINFISSVEHEKFYNLRALKKSNYKLDACLSKFIPTYYNNIIKVEIMLLVTTMKISEIIITK